VRGVDDRGHAFVDGKHSRMGNGHINHLVGVLLYVTYYEVDLFQEVREVADHLLWVGLKGHHNVARVTIIQKFIYF
jgi:hypothetical protein